MPLVRRVWQTNGSFNGNSLCSSGTTEDEVKHAEKELQKLTDDYIARIDGHLTHKEKEIMTV